VYFDSVRVHECVLRFSVCSDSHSCVCLYALVCASHVCVVFASFRVDECAFCACLRVWFCVCILCVCGFVCASYVCVFLCVHLMCVCFDRVLRV